MVTYITVSTAPAFGGYVTGREVEGGGVRGEWGAKLCDSVFIQFSFSLGKNGKLLIRLQFPPL